MKNTKGGLTGILRNSAKKDIVLKHKFEGNVCFSQIPVLGAGSNLG
jgi:hypothetical protein